MSNATRAVEAAPRMAVDRPQRLGCRAAVHAIAVAALVNLIALAASAVGAPGLLSNDTPVATPSISFWVPQLAGKMDVIPNRTNRVWIDPQTPGLYVGQCAEYCGLQHAGMLLRVIVHPQEEFAQWVAAAPAEEREESKQVELRVIIAPESSPDQRRESNHLPAGLTFGEDKIRYPKLGVVTANELHVPVSGPASRRRHSSRSSLPT